MKKPKWYLRLERKLDQLSYWMITPNLLTSGDFALYIRDELQELSWKSMVAMGAVFFSWGYIVSAAAPKVYLTKNFPLMMIMLVVMAAALWFSERNHFLSQLFWVGGMGVLIETGMWTYQRPEILFFFSLLPVMAALLCGWPFGALVYSGVVLRLALTHSLFTWVEIPNWYADITLLITTIGLFISWMAVVSRYSLLKRFFVEYRQANKQMEDARQQRASLLETQEDLLCANRELARLSDRMKILTQVAEDARRVKEEFVANVSHELRTPLNMIIGFSELISKAPRIYGELPPALLADIAAIQRNSQHLSELVNDVLDLSQLETGKMTLIRESVSIKGLVDSAVSAIKVLFDTKGLYIHTYLPNNDVNLYCDATRIREVLLNLLSNAGRFTEEGGVELEVIQQGDRVQFCVSDTGTGISLENQSRLFEPFQQLDNSIRRSGGSGLGLSISKQFVELHGGKMWLESEIGRGTRLFFSLPMLIEIEEFSGVSGSKRWITPFHQPEIEFRRSKIPAPVVLPRYVLFDTSGALTRLFGRYFENVETAVARTLEEAQQALRQSPCHGLVVNAASTPNPDGVLEALKDIPSLTPVITCWIASDEEPMQMMGVTRYMVKPVLREKLLDAIENLGRRIRSVLVVDDQPEALQLFGRMLASAEKNYLVYRAKNGIQALEILRERHPDVLLLDLIMPDLDGFEVLKEKANDDQIRDIPVIVLSSKDPTGVPIICDVISVSRREGFSAREVVDCIQTISNIAIMGRPTPGPKQPIAVPE